MSETVAAEQKKCEACGVEKIISKENFAKGKGWSKVCLVCKAKDDEGANQLAHKIRLYPTRLQLDTMERTAAAQRKCFNFLLDLHTKRRDEFVAAKNAGVEKDRLPAQGVDSKELTVAMTELFPWVKDEEAKKAGLPSIPSSALHHSYKDHAAAWKKFFENLKAGAKAGRPKFKGRLDRQSFYIQNQDFAHEGKWFKFGTLGWVKGAEKLRFSGVVQSATLSKEAGVWFASIQVKTKDKPAPCGPATVGIDLNTLAGVAIAVSDGQGFEGPDLKRLKRRLKRAQQAISRKYEAAKQARKKIVRELRLSGIPQEEHRGVLRAEIRERNIKKDQLKIQKLHQRISNIRKEWQHVATTTIVRSANLIGVEDLNVKAMTVSAKGTLAEPGQKVKQKSGLNREVLNVGPGEIVRQLQYKAGLTGATVIAVQPAYTSQRCNHCGHIEADNRKTQESFECVKCGHKENADFNAAKNIRDLATGKWTAPKNSGEAKTRKRLPTLGGEVKPVEK